MQMSGVLILVHPGKRHVSLDARFGPFPRLSMLLSYFLIIFEPSVSPLTYAIDVKCRCLSIFLVDLASRWLVKQTFGGAASPTSSAAHRVSFKYDREFLCC